MTDSRHSDNQNTYAICVKGKLDQRWSDWFDGFSITYPAEDETLLTGEVIDQAALHGLLAALRDLNLPLITVKKVDYPVGHKDLSGGTPYNQKQQ